jgi:hypothetical protein
VVAFRKSVDVEPVMRLEAPDADPLLRNEIDPDPLIEEMVGRLRDGLSSLHAVDEWGRPIAWRNVVRLALGPLASKLRDTEQALELAVSMIPVPEEEHVAERRVSDRRASESEAEPVAEAVVEPVVEAADVPAEAVTAPVETPVEDVPAAPQATVDVILPAADAVSDVPVEVAGHAILVEEPIEVDEEAVKAIEAENRLAADSAPTITVAPAAPRPTGATSLFTVSGDQRAVPVSPLGARELVSGGSPDDSTAAKYDRFLTGLYGEGKQVRADEDRRPGGPGLGNHL